MKQTAVGWLVEQLRQFAFDTNHHLGLGDVRLTQGQIDELEEQAKEMEKQQMIEFGYACANQIDMNDNGELLMVKSPKELYNEKYGGNNAE
jgi:hypothetical protein